MSQGLLLLRSWWSGSVPWLLDLFLLPVSSQGLPSVLVCVQVSSAEGDTSQTGLRLTLMNSF